MVSNKHFLSPRDMARAIGVSESSLRRWVDNGDLNCTRTRGGHRKIPLTEALRFIRENSAEVVRPELLGLSDLSDVVTVAPSGNTAAALHEALLAGQASLARAIMLAEFLGSNSLAEFFDGPLHEALSNIGLLWRDQDDGVFVEHRATDICLQGLSQIRGILPDPPDGAPVAVGGSPQRDDHAMGSIMAASVLAEAGFEAVNLGARTPLSALVTAIEQYKPRVVWLSAVNGSSETELNNYVCTLSETLSDCDASLVIGGPQAKTKLACRRSNVYVLCSMTALAAFSHGVLADWNRSSVDE